MTAALLLAAIVAGHAATAEVYFTGEGTAALIAGGTVWTEGRLFPCVSCHGADGRGTAEGATEIPPVTRQALSRATDRRPAYDAEGFALALRTGLRPGGTPLSAAMTRYEMTDAVMEALVATLGRIEAEDRAAFGPRAVRVAAPEGGRGRSRLAPRHRRSCDAADADDRPCLPDRLSCAGPALAQRGNARRDHPCPPPDRRCRRARLRLDGAICHRHPGHAHRLAGIWHRRAAAL
ncbi:cytochrome c [Paracoccus siganidrum]|nr:cytochrome c [Paracoccus siganidrum]